MPRSCHFTFISFFALLLGLFGSKTDRSNTSHSFAERFVPFSSTALNLYTQEHVRSLISYNKDFFLPFQVGSFSFVFPILFSQGLFTLSFSICISFSLDHCIHAIQVSTNTLEYAGGLQINLTMLDVGKQLKNELNFEMMIYYCSSPITLFLVPT